MNLTPVVLSGIIKPDGTLELEGKLPLPAGPVQVTVQPLPELPADDPFWQRMQAMWATQKARGFTPRSVAEVEAERNAMRDEWEQRMEEIEQIQRQSQVDRNTGGPGK